MRVWIGSQCSCLRSGVTCCLFDFWRTSLAALFCILWRRAIWVTGRPARVSFQQSNLDSTHEHSSWTVFFSVRYLRMDAIYLIARYAGRRKWLICCSIDRVLSKNTPRLFTCGFNKMFFFPPIWIDSAYVRFMVWREPTSMASVLFHHLAWACYWASKPSQTENKTQNLKLNNEIPRVGMPCGVAYHLQISGNWCCAL